MQRPIFMLVSGDGPRLDALRHDLSRRYEADYQVCVASSAAAALTMLAVLAGARAEVALVIADEHLADMPAVDFLARALYAASEGLATVVLEPEMPGGQAGTSSLIRNYLGFPHGLSGDNLAMRAVNQAWLFGAGFTLGAADGLTAQAAIHLSKYAASVTMVVRGPGLTASMSSYLVTEISKTANIRVRPSTEVTGGHGQCSLETLTLRQRVGGATETVPAAALFVMIGAEPGTSWLPGSIERDDEGFIRTGRDLHRAGELPAGWPLKRPPLLLETSVPGVFAAGDVRHRSVKRVASAVGEGATAIQLVHEHLRAEQA